MSLAVVLGPNFRKFSHALELNGRSFKYVGNYIPVGRIIRSDRIQDLRSLKDGDWDLHTLLVIYDGLINCSSQINHAAADTLIALARKYPAMDHEFSPIALRVYYMPSFTVTSGYRPRIFRTLCKLNTPVADQDIELLMNNYLRNEDFKLFLQILIDNGKKDVLSEIQQKKSSKTKQQILNKTLKVMEIKQPQK